MLDGRRERRALARSLRLTTDNNDTEKYFLWVTLGLFALGGIGKVTGTYQPDPALWKFIMGVMAFLAGRVQGKESERLKGEAGE